MYSTDLEFRIQSIMKNSPKDPIEINRACSCAADPENQTTPPTLTNVADTFHRFMTRLTLAIFRLADHIPDQKKREEYHSFANSMSDYGNEFVAAFKDYAAAKDASRRAPTIRVNLPPKYKPGPTTIAEARAILEDKSLKFPRGVFEERRPLMIEPENLMALNVPRACVVIPAAPVKPPGISITLRNPGDAEFRAGIQDVETGAYYWVVFRGTVSQVRIEGRPTSPRFPNHDAIEVTFFSSRFSSLPVGTSLILHDLETYYFRNEVVANDFWTREIEFNR